LSSMEGWVTGFVMSEKGNNVRGRKPKIAFGKRAEDLGVNVRRIYVHSLVNIVEFLFRAYTNPSVTPPCVGLRERLSVGEREIAPEGGEVREHWGGGAREVR